MADYVIVSPTGQRMLKVLPDLYEKVYETRVLMETEGQELDEVGARITDVFDQAVVDRATWGLASWEGFLGIKTDASKPYDQRRSVINSKVRGTGTVTLALLKRVAEAYDNGQVEVTADPANYKVIIKFISSHGVPANLTDIETALLDIMPAHLAINFVFTYMTWTALDAHAFTWGSLSANDYTWKQFESLT
ncbi:putative phage tail protein [Paenibacillus alba]|uniref:DUF2313 domain-containing protein n=1 Tax=Paenibacillus alba TaxID=1197127 RepID=A0ABU6GDH3_9BACL|nr:putative phage tail protein [Paenibacillus alba]MEC0232265.1 DUF2313 domain-containing protein [Paenibacillus alba]